jgi:hypothetical protein
MARSPSMRRTTPAELGEWASAALNLLPPKPPRFYVQFQAYQTVTPLKIRLTISRNLS